MFWVVMAVLLATVIPYLAWASQESAIYKRFTAVKVAMNSISVTCSESHEVQLPIIIIQFNNKGPYPRMVHTRYTHFRTRTLTLH